MPLPSTYTNPYVVAESDEVERSQFIRRTYLHLAGAILVFAGLEAWLLTQKWALALAGGMLNMWWVVLLAFIGVSWVANWFAHSNASRGMQYLGLGLFVVAEAAIFLPILAIAYYQIGPDVIAKAGMMTIGLFLGLTAVALTTKANFSFLGGFLKIAFFVALGLIAVAMIFPGSFTLGTWFSVAMVIVAGAAILYTTSGMLYEYRPDQHVAASLSLFASVAMMFFYILRIFMNRG